MKELKFKEIAKMFNLLREKGYTIEEIMEMPILIGECRRKYEKQ